MCIILGEIGKPYGVRLAKSTKNVYKNIKDLSYRVWRVRGKGVTLPIPPHHPSTINFSHTITHPFSFHHGLSHVKQSFNIFPHPQTFNTMYLNHNPPLEFNIPRVIFHLFYNSINYRTSHFVMTTMYGCLYNIIFPKS